MKRWFEDRIPERYREQFDCFFDAYNKAKDIIGMEEKDSVRREFIDSFMKKSALTYEHKDLYNHIFDSNKHFVATFKILGVMEECLNHLNESNCAIFDNAVKKTKDSIDVNFLFSRRAGKIITDPSLTYTPVMQIQEVIDLIKQYIMLSIVEKTYFDDLCKKFDSEWSSNSVQI